jgi:hypothetical protein
MDLMVRLKELQRRMDQILGVPKMSDRERAKFTINARLSRVEEQTILINSKLDDCIVMLRSLIEPTPKINQ